VEFASDPIFAFEVPKTCDGISPELLNPSKSWADKKAYKTNYLQLAGFHIENFKKFDGEFLSEIIKAGPTNNRF
ncbi:MAG: phosphoenolpyruvate carboxykinase (ATP), partial [candidate division Zixibacteria bacterium]|nr:phosphoenolpyruvate carboxykinase (ATP) [candidate division Zixibacteria bacterium]